MRDLNLTANDKSQERILAYLQENASETLAEKINNGVPIQKDGKRLINRKTLDGFIKFATDEAKKLAQKGASAACIDDETVYGWAIHYFEEDSIEGTLFNEDGSEYKPVVKAAPKSTTTAPKPVEKPKETNKQASLFDLFDNNDESKEDEEKSEDVTEKIETVPEEPKQKITPQEKPIATTGHPFYQDYMEVQNKYPESVIAYRLGDFYEIFGENAVTIANELNMTLTSRDCGISIRVPMVGFPYHAADIYFEKISKFHDLTIAEDKTTIHRLQKKKIIDKETGVIMDVKPSDAIADKLSEMLKIQITVR